MMLQWTLWQAEAWDVVLTFLKIKNLPTKFGTDNIVARKTTHPQNAFNLLICSYVTGLKR